MSKGENFPRHLGSFCARMGLIGMGYLSKYFHKVPEGKRSSAAIAYMASLDAVHEHSPHIAEAVVQELRDQRSSLKMIASENYSSLATQLAMGNLLTDKYSEGVAGRRFYAGCENVDLVEKEASDLAKALFSSPHAYVQPHSGADANLVAYWAILLERVQNRLVDHHKKKSVDELTAAEYEEVRKALVSQKIMGLSLSSGGHLTHGFRHNVSSKFFTAVSYDVDPITGLLDYGALFALAKREKPLILVAGYSAYPRLIDFAKMREIADAVGAVLLVDMAHFAGLVAGKVFQGDYNPIPFASVVTSTTHKTLRGPRGGLILCQEEFRESVDKGCPLVLGGPLPHVMAAKAVAFREALRPSFATYAEQIVRNASHLAEELIRRGVKVATGGTDNHLLLIDVANSFRLTGRQAESALREAGLTANRNALPGDVNGAWYTSGVRLGTPAITTLGMKEGEMAEIAAIIAEFLRHVKPAADSRAKVEIDPEALSSAKSRIKALLYRFPLYKELEIE